MQYTPHYNLNLPEGTDIVNPLIQDNPNYSAIDDALYNNKLRVVGNATHTKTGTNHSIVLADSDIKAFKFVATGDYVTGDTFSVDGVTVTARAADGGTIPTGAFKINSTVMAILDGTLLNLINVTSVIDANAVQYDSNDTVKQKIDANIASINALDARFGTKSGGSFNDITESGLYYCNGVESLYCFLIVIKSDLVGRTEIKQIRIANDSNIIEVRSYWNSTWSAWSVIHS